MKILEVLTYYRPWVSGLTLYVEWLNRALVRQGYDVTVLTSQYSPNLERYEVADGVKIVRVPVALRVSKGVIMPGFGPMAWKLAQRTDVIHLHLPQFDAPGVALRGRILGKPVVLTYHCDLRLPPGLFNRAVDRVISVLNRFAGDIADAIVTYTEDYAIHSPYLSPYLGRKLKIIPPPVQLTRPSSKAVKAFGERHGLAGRKVIGFSGRLATEKGVEVLLRALPVVLDSHPRALILHAGMVKGVVGEEAYATRLAPLFEKYRNSYRLLGNLDGEEYAAFHNNLDCLVICSLNSTESFGLVQIEAMINGNPVAACDLPGVRQPVLMTGMGEISPAGDHEALARVIVRMLDDKTKYAGSSATITKSFSPDLSASLYAALFKHLLNGRPDVSADEPAAYHELRAMRDRAVRPEAEG
jgi:glycosyltransferase involved in cell wall biosynthesis